MPSAKALLEVLPVNCMQFCLRIVIFCLVLLSESAGQAAERQVLKGHVPAAMASLTPVDRVPATRQLHMAINLPLRNRDALNTLLQQFYDPASPSFHHFLTSEEFTAAFGPTKEDYEAVVNFARANGLSVTAHAPTGLCWNCEGPAANFEKAFHVSLRVYPHPYGARNFYAPDVEPSLELEVPVLHCGTDGLPIAAPGFAHVRKLENHSNVTPNLARREGIIYWTRLSRAYAQGVTNTGTGQSVGLLEFDSYYAATLAIT